MNHSFLCEQYETMQLYFSDFLAQKEAFEKEEQDFEETLDEFTSKPSESRKASIQESEITLPPPPPVEAKKETVSRKNSKNSKKLRANGYDGGDEDDEDNISEQPRSRRTSNSSEKTPKGSAKKGKGTKIVMDQTDVLNQSSKLSYNTG